MSPPRRSRSGHKKSGKPAFRPRPERRDPADEASPHGDRLQKLLAAAGLGSRRACEELILTGRVEVDRQTVTTLGTRVDPLTQEIRVDGETLPKPRPTYVMVHKTQGVVSTARDPSGRPRVTDMVPPELGRLFPVGRLDMSSEGLILLTNDGELANRLTHPRYGIEKTYRVQVAGQIQQNTLDELERGIYLAEGVAKVVGVSIKTHHKNSTILEMILDEGRNREIRRLLARVGHKVQRLVRIAMGPLKLGDMPAGAYRLLRADEISALHECVSDIPPTDRPRKKGRPQQGSRKLLLSRKAGASPGKPTGSAARSPGQQPGQSSPGRFGSAAMPGKKSPAARGTSGVGVKPATKKSPQPRTIIGEDETRNIGREEKSGSAKPGKFRPAGKAKRKGKPAFRQGRSTGK